MQISLRRIDDGGNIEDAPIYVTANTLVSESITLADAIQIARDARADDFELPMSSCPFRCNLL